MKPVNKKTGAGRQGQGGYTTYEVLVAVAIMAVLLAIATPPFVQWRNELNSGRGARGAYDALRQARSRALVSNYQHMVSFDPSHNRYQVLKGRRSFNTPGSEWVILTDWCALSKGVSMKSGSGGTSTASVNVQFNADGTARLETPAGTAVVPPASTVTIAIQGGSDAKRNSITVSNCGRITFE